MFCLFCILLFYKKSKQKKLCLNNTSNVFCRLFSKKSYKSKMSARKI